MSFKKLQNQRFFQIFTCLLAVVPIIVILFYPPYSEAIGKQTFLSIAIAVVATACFCFIIIALFKAEIAYNFSVIDFVLLALFIYSAIFLLLRFEIPYASYNLKWAVLYGTSFIFGKFMAVNIGKTVIWASIFLVAVVHGFWSFLQILPFLETKFLSFNVISISMKGGYYNSSMLACILALGILCGIHLSKCSTSKILRIVMVIGVVLLALLLLITLSRAALLMCLFGVLLLFRVRIKYILVLSLLIIAPFLFYKKDSIEGRLLIWRVSTEIIAENLWTGVGFNRFQAEYNTYQGLFFEKNQDLESGRLLAANNYFAFNELLRVLVELGVFGFLLLLFLLFLYARLKIDFIEKALLGAFLVFALFSYPLADIKNSFLLFVLMGVAANEQSAMFKNVSKKGSLIVPGCTGLTLTILLIIEIGQLKKLKSWQTSENLRLGSPGIAMELYQDLEESFSGNPEFNHSLGALLFKYQKYSDALPLLEKGVAQIPSSDIYVYTGLCQEALGEKERAKYHLELSTQIVPHLIIPKYHLFHFYLRAGEQQNARRIGNKILNQKAKTISPAILEIRKEIATFIYGNKTIKK